MNVTKNVRYVVKNCSLCIYCKANVFNNCNEREIRNIIDVILFSRNLVAHCSVDIWKTLANGTFSSNDFRGVRTWKDLSQYIFLHNLKLLSYLEHNGIISTEEYKNSKYDLNKVFFY